MTLIMPPCHLQLGATKAHFQNENVPLLPLIYQMSRPYKLQFKPQACLWLIV